MKAWPRAGRWAMYVAIAILFAVACGFLSHWQFSRNAGREAANALIADNYDATPVAVDELLPEGSDFDPGDEWRQVVLTGEYLADKQVLARNRPRGNTSAYEALVPFRLDDGRVIVVDRGWVEPVSGVEASEVPDPPEGEVTVVARLRPSEAEPRNGRGAPEGQVATIWLPGIASDLADDGVAGEVVDDAYALMASEDPAPAAAPNQIDRPEQDPGPFLSYAVQWILFAVMGFGFIGYMIRTEIVAARAPEPDPDDDDDDDPLPPPRPKRRAPRPSDEDIEDALLDA
ncbi:SURF1 family protein [Microbacterium indicum]|uniref:SURF1 family cytochrome oxidase biogenesis protein n=1 Tax=Microbacterium indicum TaxID=358100 RepID=UPI00040FC799|nr:SURF1 family protein [Microbacterium indicum]